MNNDLLKNMMETQQNMMNSWQDMYKNMAQVENNPFAKPIQDYIDMQKKFMDALNDKKQFDPTTLFDHYFKAPDFDPNVFEYFSNMQKMYIDLMQNFAGSMGFKQNNAGFGDLSKMMDMSRWTNGANNMNLFFQELQKIYKPLKIGEAFDTDVKELLEKIMNANKYYLNLYQFWKEIESKQFKPAADELKKYTQETLEKYDAMFSDMVIPMIPEEFRAFVKDPVELMKSYRKTATDFYEPWISNSDQLRDLFMEGIVSDKSKMASFFELWRTQFDKTYGALLLSPAVGANKELIEQQNKAFDTFLDLAIFGMDFTTRIHTVQNENVGSILERYLKLIEEGKQPKTFREFYDYWASQNEKVFESYFATPEYSKLLGEVSAAAMDYRIELHKLVERYLIDTPIVTRSEMNSLYKTVYDLKKELKAVKKNEYESEEVETTVVSEK